MSLTLKISFNKQLSRLVGAISALVVLNCLMPRQVYGQEVDRDSLCKRFPLNSRCNRFGQKKRGGFIYTTDELGGFSTRPESLPFFRGGIGEEKTPGTQQEKSNPGQRQSTPSENGANQIIKVRLKLSGPDNEWIRIEMSNNRAGGTVLTAYHTKRVRRTLLSNLATGFISFRAEELASEAIDGYDGPVPVPDINFYRWANHETRQIVFVPDGCSDNSPVPLGNGQQLGQSSCVITGTNSITLLAGIDIRGGLFTIEYAEQDLVRTITFRVPPERS